MVGFWGADGDRVSRRRERSSRLSGGTPGRSSSAAAGHRSGRMRQIDTMLLLIRPSRSTRGKDQPGNAPGAVPATRPPGRLLTDGFDQPEDGTRALLAQAIRTLRDPGRPGLEHVRVILATRGGPSGAVPLATLGQAHRIPLRPPNAAELVLADLARLVLLNEINSAGAISPRCLRSSVAIHTVAPNGGCPAPSPHSVTSGRRTVSPALCHQRLRCSGKHLIKWLIV